MAQSYTKDPAGDLSRWIAFLDLLASLLRWGPAAVKENVVGGKRRRRAARWGRGGKGGVDMWALVIQGRRCRCMLLMVNGSRRGGCSRALLLACVVLRRRNLVQFRSETPLSTPMSSGLSQGLIPVPCWTRGGHVRLSVASHCALQSSSFDRDIGVNMRSCEGLCYIS